MSNHECYFVCLQILCASFTMSEPHFIKLFVVGDGGVGKTSLLITYTTKEFPSPYIPIVYDTLAIDIELPNEEQKRDGGEREGKGGKQPATTTDQPSKLYKVGLWDPSGGEDFDRLRPLSYPQTDVFLICFDINNERSFENVRNRWQPEITHYMPSTPWLLVGTKSDLRADVDFAMEPAAESSELKTTNGCISAEKARKEAASLNAVKYMECSALKQEGLDELFVDAVKAAAANILKEKKNKIKCLLI